MPYKQSNFLVIMNYEKKYKDALELARIAAFNGHQSLMEGIFPELAESEDEKIRKELIDIVEKSPITFAFEDKGKVLAWLEKQGEFYTKRDVDNAYVEGMAFAKNELEKQGKQEYTEWHREDEQNLNACLGYIPDEFLRRWLTDIIHVKYDNLADKIEPKFKAGDWVVCKNGSHRVFKVIERSWPNAKYLDEKGAGGFLNVFTLDKQYHLWTIEDAKDGDVLVTNSNIIFIFKYLDEGGTIAFRASCTENSGVYFPKIKERLCDQDVHPATKEQRDLLFQKMKEAGYEWDFEKKELKKIKQKPANYAY